MSGCGVGAHTGAGAATQGIPSPRGGEVAKAGEGRADFRGGESAGTVGGGSSGPSAGLEQLDGEVISSLVSWREKEPSVGKPFESAAVAVGPGLEPSSCEE
eukprot:764740-Prorocentrum_minimum.AAC.1